MSESNNKSIQRHGKLTGGRPGPTRFSKFTIHANTLYVAGQVPYDTSDLTYKGQTEQVCAYLRSIDEGADGYNEAWDAWADKQNLPVRTTIEAKLMSPDFLVEIDLVAAVL